MKLSELSQKYYNLGNNCARAILMATNEKYNLDIAEIDMSLLSGFGGGMYVENTCGVVTGGVAALGKYMALNQCDNKLKDIIPAYITRFDQRLGSIACGPLKEMYIKEATGCIETVILGADVLEEIITEI